MPSWVAAGISGVRGAAGGGNEGALHPSIEVGWLDGQSGRRMLGQITVKIGISG